MVNAAKEYFGGLPGHADSGQPFPKNFATNAGLLDYIKERKAAADKFIGQ